ncbi:armadillo-type protein [Gongronella butleri]|nr:armadillo-type protein [Gongronella butleri]
MDSLAQLRQCLFAQQPVTPAQLSAALLQATNSKQDNKDITDQQRIDLIVQGTTVIPLDHDASSVFCQFMFKQCSKYIRLSSIRANAFEKCIGYLLAGLEIDDVPADRRVDVLRALSSLLFENAANTAKYYTRLIPLLLKFAHPSVKTLEIRRMAINCLGNACAGAGTKMQAHYHLIYEQLIANLCVVDASGKSGAAKTFDMTDPAIRKIASSTLRALQFALLQCKSIVDHSRDDIFSILHSFIFIQVNVHSYQVLQELCNDSTGKSKTTSASLPLSQRPVSRPPAPTYTSTLSHQRAFWRVAPLNTSSSDSELSDSESGTPIARRVRDDAKIRTNALLCMLAIAKTSPRFLYPQWHRLIPDNFTAFLKNNSIGDELAPNLKSDRQLPSLLTILLYDPLPAVRKTVCQTLIAMFDGSSQYLSVASERDTKSSFTSLSENLASLLRDLHLGLAHALLNEKDTDVLSMIMKVVLVLVNNVTYERLAHGHLTRFYCNLMTLWHATTCTMTLGSILQVMATIMAIGTDEVTTLMTDGVGVHEAAVPFLISLAQDSAQDLMLQHEAWGVLSACAKHHFSDMVTRWPTLALLVDKAQNSENEQTRGVSLGFIESYALALASWHEASEKQDTLDACISWWQQVLAKYIQQASLDTSAQVKGTACDCLAAMSMAIFEQLPARHQRLAIALLMPLPEDEEASVRAAACRAIGVFTLFPTLREDECFVSDVATAILNGMEDSSLLVRLRASWAQGNLCDALVITNDSLETFQLQERISFHTWTRMLHTANHAALDNDKLRPNAVRALGGLLRVTPEVYFDHPSSMPLVQGAMATLIKNMEAGSLKTRWNACHAASNLLKNPGMPIGYLKAQEKQFPWTARFYKSLLQCMTNCKNYKVRINACLALASPSSVRQFGDEWKLVYQGVIATLQSCQADDNTADYKEYKYHDQLSKQAHTTLCHLWQWLPADLQAKYIDLR